MTSPFKIRSLQAFCYRYPLATPVVTSFGKMLDRPAVFVRVEDEDGVTGFGAWRLIDRGENLFKAFDLPVGFSMMLFKRRTKLLGLCGFCHLGKC